MTNNRLLASKPKKISKSPVDSRWFSRFSRIASFQLYDYLAGNWQFRNRQKKLFLERKTENPKLDYPLLDLKKLGQKEAELKKLSKDISKKEKNVLVRDAYQEKIQEKILEIQLLRASCKKDWSKFSFFCKKLYGLPSLAAQGHTATWLQDKTRRARKAKKLKSWAKEIRETELLTERWLKKIPKKFRSLNLPAKPLFSKVFRTFERDLQTILEPDLRQKPPYNAKKICKIFNRALEAMGDSEWKATVVKSNSTSASADLSKKTIRIPHKKYLHSSDLRALIVHEIGTHVKRQLNGEKSSLLLLGLGLDRYEESEEGLATLKEQLVRDGFDDFSGFPGFLALCLALGCDGEKRNFRQVYEKLISIFFLLNALCGKKRSAAKDEAAQEAWERGVRTFRGTDCSTPGVCFTKDIIYREGNLKLWNFLLRSETDISDLDAGKYDPLNPKHVRLLKSLGVIRRARGARQEEKKNELIINADDFGMSKKINEGILELAKRNIVTSTSVLAMQKHAFSKELLALPVSIGLHLDLTDNLASPAIEKETKKQLKKFVSLYKKLPSHIDGHNNCHLAPRIFPKIIKLAKKYNLPIRSLSNKHRSAIRKSGLKTPSRIIWWNAHHRHILFQDLRKKSLGTTELLCHPGYFDPESNLSYNKQREQELIILKSPAFKLLLKNFRLTDYSRLPDQKDM